jgi:hypothetical protein
METGNSAWVPGDAERTAGERLALGTTGLYGDLPPGVGPLLEVAAKLVAQAFTAFAEGDWETSDGLVTEGRRACGHVFTAFVEHVASPGCPYRVDSPFWEDFLDRLAAIALRPDPEPGPASPSLSADSVSLADELRAMGLM